MKSLEMKEKVAKELSNNLFLFTNIVFRENYEVFHGGDYIKQVCDFLQYNKKTVRIGPKDHFKSSSLYTFLMWEIWRAQFEGGFGCFYFSYDRSQAFYHLSKLKLLIKSNPYFQDLVDYKTLAEGLLKFSWNGKDFCVIKPKGLLCLRGDQQILTSAGEKPISNMKIGELAFSKDGKWHKVSDVLSKQFKKNLVEIKTRNLVDSIVVSKEHKIFAIKNPKCFQKTVRGFCFPYCSRKDKHCKFKGFPELKWIQAGNLEKGDIVVFPKIKERSASPYPRDVLRLFGYYLAEGCLNLIVDGKGRKRGGRVRWTINSGEKSIMEDIQSIVRKYFSGSVSSFDKKGENCKELTTINVKLCKMLEKEFGHGARNKRIPIWMESIEFDDFWEFLKGYWLGDGYKNSPSFSICSANKNILRSIQRALFNFNISSSIIKFDSCKEKNLTAFRLESVSERLLKMTGKKKVVKRRIQRIWFDDNYCYLPIKEVSEIYHEGLVWDMTVEDEHNYIANSVLVSNSFKRGIHEKIILVDDPFQDPANLLDPVIVKKINEIFKTQIMDMPFIDTGRLHVVMCLATDTIIPVLGKGLLKLSEVKKDDFVFGFDIDSYKMKRRKVSFLVDNGIQECLEIETQYGRNIISTYNHPFLKREGWTRAELLKVGDSIALANFLPEEGKPNDFSDDEILLLGYLIGDGSFGKHETSFSNSDLNILENVMKICTNLDIGFTLYPKRRGAYRLWLKGKIWNFRKKFNLPKLGFSITSINKSVPNNIFPILTNHQIKLLFAGLTDTDGCLHKRGFSYYSISGKLIDQLSYLLLRLGFSSRLDKAHNCGMTKKTTLFNLQLTTKDDVLKFLDIIKDSSVKAKSFKFDPPAHPSGNNIPLLNDEFKILSRKFHLSSKNISTSSLSQSNLFPKLLSNDVRWLKIKSIKKVGKKPTLNLTVSGGNFVANNFITHNTPQTNDDFCFDSALMERVKVLSQPAEYIDPKTNEKKALWPEHMPLAELEIRRRERGDRVYMREYMCSPGFSADTFWSREKVERMIDVSLFHLHELKTENTVCAGWDVGKFRHPAHITIFERVGDIWMQRFQQFMDGWDYSAQVEEANSLVKRFKIDFAYFDATGREIESFRERKILNPIWKPVIFKTETKWRMVNNMEGLREKGRLKLIPNSRQTNQLLVVNNSLQAFETIEGHGEPFFSMAMALLAELEFGRTPIKSIGIIPRRKVSPFGRHFRG